MVYRKSGIFGYLSFLAESERTGRGFTAAYTATAVGCRGFIFTCIRRVQPIDIEYLKALEETLAKWASATDEKTYCEL
ncbi:hypothetical protein Neut_1400 [Nitrosomonas eutropha C91]|uniref:Uncharacterized protein n=1 Tax=Nitrosomonas eutropha (strain DSM 101675 / C91 / Nm57) TaxID=335283 RepID=Q0AG84_NITEC|nr:hypothetical protein Neut_1400 [Nitrosomonas eutropha C91]